MMRPKLPRDPAQRALAVVEQSTAEPDEEQGFAALAQVFWEETGVIAPGIEIPPPLKDQWGEAKRWELWRAWLVRHQTDGGKPPDHVAFGRKGGLKGGHSRAAKLSPEQRREIAKKAAAARWTKPGDLRLSAMPGQQPARHDPQGQPP